MYLQKTQILNDNYKISNKHYTQNKNIIFYAKTANNKRIY